MPFGVEQSFDRRLGISVLELIFAHLSGNDLVSVANVSRSFYASVLPQLYRSLFFRLSQAKRCPKVSLDLYSD